jgi:hypothetical protein
MQIPIINGIYTTESADFRQKYPHNMMPVALNHGISAGYFRPADGVSYYPEIDTLPSLGSITGSGDDRGAINWNDKMYRVNGNVLNYVDSNGVFFEISSTPTSVSIEGIKRVRMTYSFDYLAIVGGGNLYLYGGPEATFPANALQQVTDSDLGNAIDVIYIDGYFMTTDGQYLVVTDLNNPFSVNNLKYGSSEIDPDPVIGIEKLNNEAYAINRYTIEAFYNAGGALFPFKRIDGSRMYRGAVGANAKCIFMDQIAFLGSGKNESLSIYLGRNAQTQKIGTREIDLILQEYTEDQLKDAVLETRIGENFQHLWVRLPDKILIYDGTASISIQAPIWFTIDSGPKNLCWCYDRWNVGNQNAELGYLDTSISTIWGESRNWDFQTQIIYNDSKGAIIHQLELVGLPGRGPIGLDPTIWTSYSLDGETWSQEWKISAGKQGDRTKRLVWFNQGFFRNYRIQKFRGNSDAHIAFAKLEAQLEALSA